MHEWNKMVKNLCILLWCGWVILATPFIVFSAGSFVEGICAFAVALYAFAIPAHWLEP